MYSVIMKTIRALCDYLLEKLGYPASLMRFLQAENVLNRHLAVPSKSICASEVVRWNEFGTLPYETRRMHPRKLNGWTRRPGSYQNYGATSLSRDDLLNLGTVKEVEGWRCEIQDVEGFSASKSELRNFQSTDAMVVRNSMPMITPVSKEKLEENLRWDEIRIISRKDHDHFATWEWDGRLFLINSGGSHHFAAAKYIAKRLNIDVHLQGRHITYGINQSALASLRRDFDIYVIPRDSIRKIEFLSAMQSFEATYYWKDLPRPYTEQAAIFLPKSEKQALKVSQVLSKAGFQDLGLYLQNLTRDKGIARINL